MLSPFDYPWRSDQGDGAYRNPVLHADYSDPDVVRHGDAYWMTASSLTCTPGLPILRSPDLVNWRLVGHALRQVPTSRYADVQPGAGVWAPSLRHHAGKFWIFFGMPDEGIYVTTATDPTGPWTAPWLLQSARGWIDPCPFWDRDGRAYLIHAFAHSRCGLRDRLHLRPMSPDARQILGEGHELIHAPHHPYLEGPKMYRIGEYYYILAPGGGVTRGWQVAFRARSIHGPYEERVVLQQGRTAINGPHQGALLDGPDGRWWFFHFQDAGAFGRVNHLQPVEWEDGWPMMGKAGGEAGVREPVEAWTKPTALGQPAPIETPAASDEFDATHLGFQWQWQANHHSWWADLKARPGWLRLAARPIHGRDLILAPHLLSQKFPARRFVVETWVEPCANGEPLAAGLVVSGGDIGFGLLLNERGDLVEWCGDGPSIVAESVGSALRLRLRVESNASCRFAYATASGPWVELPTPHQASSGGWMGARVGLIAQGLTRSADFDYFRFNH